MIEISPLWQDGFTLFLSIVVQALPFLLLGIGLSGVLAVFVDEAWLARWLPQGRWRSSLAGGVLGFFFPVCECGNLPVARRLVIKGVPPHVAIAFLLAAPVFNPVVILATWIAFRAMPEIVIYRVILSLGIAVLVGWIFSFQPDLDPILHPLVQRERSLQQPSRTQPRSLLQGGTFFLPTRTLSATIPTMSLIDPPSSEPESALVQRSLPFSRPQTAEFVYRTALERSEPISIHPGQVFRFTDRLSTSLWQQKLNQLVMTWSRELRELGGVLVMGASIAAIIQTALPRSVLVEFGQGPVISVFVMLGLAVIVSICSTVDAFFALAFAATFTPGSLLAFLVFGPMIDLKAIGLMLTLFRPRVIAYLVILTCQFTLIAALTVNFFGS